MIHREAYATLQAFSRGYPVIALTGPRQSGKTTLARAVFSEKSYVSLEDPDERAYAAGDPRGFLSRFPDGAVLDEVQRCPELFSYLQTRVDLDGRMGLFVLTGSQQFGLLSGITQSLAGRVALVHLLPFAARELREAGVSPGTVEELLFRGLYPPLYDRELEPRAWYASYVATYLERDVRQISHIRDLGQFHQFVRMCAARTGQLLNLSALGNDCGVSHVTARHWLSVLEASYVVFLLRPHHRNFGKRLVKSPKLYFHDTGLACSLLGIQDLDHLSIHPSRGALFETFVVNEFLKRVYNAGEPHGLHFWRDHTGHEVDLLIEQGPALLPVEIKAGKTFSPDYVLSLEHWSSLAGDHAGPGRLVYAGETGGVRSGIQLVPWNVVT